MATTTHQSTMIALILQEQFGESAQTQLTTKQVKEALFLLIQHNIVSYTEAAEGLRVVCYYSVNPLQVLLRDRFPLYIKTAKDLFGNYGAEIIAEILKQGKCTFETIQKLYPLDAHADEVLDAFEEAFNKLLEQNFVVQVGDDDSVSILDRKVSEELAEVAKNPNMTANEKSKMKKSLEARNKDVEFEDMPTGNKRKLIYTFEEGDNKAAKTVDEEYDATKSYWRINPSRFHVHSRNKSIVTLSETRVNSSAKEVMKFILDYAEPTMKHCKLDETSDPINLTHIASRMDLSLITYHPTNSRGAIIDYLTLLTQDQDFPFLTKTDDRGGGQYVANLFDLRNALHEALVLAYVKEKFGIVAARIWKLLKTKGMLGEKEVAKLALISNKAARETLFLMMDCGMILLQDVPKTVDHAPSRTFYLWYVSLPKCVETLIQETYQMIANLKIRRLKEYNAHGQLIEKIERSDIKADESLLTDGERLALDQFNGMMNKLRVSELRLETVYSKAYTLHEWSLEKVSSSGKKLFARGAIVTASALSSATYDGNVHLM
ncbi:UNVERIFIED_CONTAM: DNA-directed RNA polymerase III subunit RPC3 [Siphonaria sp. JEL0065]|nr:DNA-directed RNA polymerase III subunit RPC3 [Siphonaria sp. JEL0065]